MLATQVKAINMQVLLSDGSKKPLSDFWEEQPLILVFLRHFGWPFCRQQAAQLRRKEKQFQAQGAQVVLVGLGTSEQAETFRRELDLNFPIVCDPDRRLYAAYGLKRIGFWELASPALLVKGLKALSQGHSMGLPSGDIYQLPGVFIIDPTGHIRFSHFARDPADHPSADTILAALSNLNRA